MAAPSFTAIIQTTHQQLKAVYNTQYAKHITSSTSTPIKQANEFLTNYGPSLFVITQLFCLLRSTFAYTIGFALGAVAADAATKKTSDWDAKIVGEDGMKDAALVTVATRLIFPEIAAFSAGMAGGSLMSHAFATAQNNAKITAC